MKDGRKLLREIGSLGKAAGYFRAHSLLVTGDGTPALKWGSTNAYTEDAQGRPIYDWTIIDRIFRRRTRRRREAVRADRLHAEGALDEPRPYQHEWRPGFPYNDIYTGWTYPPKDMRNGPSWFISG
jgi:xylan 1,4-beta-xylosidase